MLLLVTGLSLAQVKVVVDDKKGVPMLIGSCTREAFLDTSYATWFNEGYDSYVTDSTASQKLPSLLSDVQIEIVMGTWCGDSKEHVPHFFKLIDEINFKENNVHIICVDRNKKGYANEVEELKIERVPTFILYKNGKEIGRIIETPEPTLESQMVSILTDYRK